MKEIEAKLPRLSMGAEITFLHHDKGTNTLTPIEPQCISPGGYEFLINGKSVPFDWDAYSGSFDEDGVFAFETGYGPFFNSFELPDYYDEDLVKEGLTRMDLTAEFLSKCDEIREFYINFECNDGTDEADVYPIIKNISLLNMDSNSVAAGACSEFFVKDDVIKAYNDSVLSEIEGGVLYA